MIVRQLLDLALDTALGRVLDVDVGAQKHVRVQLGFTGGAPPDAIDMQSRPEEVVGEDGGVRLIGGDRRNDCRPYNRLDNARARPQVEPQASEVAHAFGGGSRIDVVEAQSIDAEQSLEG